MNKNKCFFNMISTLSCSIIFHVDFLAFLSQYKFPVLLPSIHVHFLMPTALLLTPLVLLDKSLSEPYTYSETLKFMEIMDSDVSVWTLFHLEFRMLWTYYAQMPYLHGIQTKSPKNWF